MLLNIVLISLSLWIRLHTSSSLLYIFSLIHQLHLAILVESIYYIRGTIYEGKSYDLPLCCAIALMNLNK
jgi:hypothetical protein